MYFFCPQITQMFTDVFSHGFGLHNFLEPRRLLPCGMFCTSVIVACGDNNPCNPKNLCEKNAWQDRTSVSICAIYGAKFLLFVLLPAIPSNPIYRFVFEWKTMHSFAKTCNLPPSTWWWRRVLYGECAMSCLVNAEGPEWRWWWIRVWDGVGCWCVLYSLKAHSAHTISFLQREIFRSYSACYFVHGAHLVTSIYALLWLPLAHASIPHIRM